MNSEKILDKDFWNDRWERQETGWDIGYASPAITEFMKDYPNKDAAILIPGCGNAYEAEFLLEAGFTNITLIDIAPKAVERLQQKFQSNPEIQILCEDYFEHKGIYDLQLEQTFFCALNSDFRNIFSDKVSSLLKVGGAFVGVLFNREFELQGPPFGGSKEKYFEIFSKQFEIKKLENCYNSIPPRKDSELFIHLIKK